LFEREHHRRIALVLQSLRAEVLAGHQCWFAGGTAMALRFGEYRESLDIDFLVSDRGGYRALRATLSEAASLVPIVRAGLRLEQTRPLRADQYGLRTQLRVGDLPIKFEIVLEGRIELARPSTRDAVCGVATLSRLDLAAEKLLANADRWADDSVFSRDLIDLAMHPGPLATLRTAVGKAEVAYGSEVRRALRAAIDALRVRRGRLDACMHALAIGTVSKAQLWQRIRRLSRLAT
jgi:Nucleotidyl transferase AbiEii toxin, Type IV TA system